MLRSRAGIVYAEVLAERDGDAYCYTIESEVGVDIRKSLFYTLAERNWPLIGMEALGMSLEDVFIAIVDQTEANKNRYAKKDGKKAQKRRGDAEKDIAAEVIKNTGKKQGGEFSALFGDDEDNR